MSYPTPGTPGPRGPDGPPGPAGPTIDSFLQTNLNWTGSQIIAAGGYQNFFALAGIAVVAGGTSGLALDSGVIKLPAKTKWSQVVFSTRISGTITGAAGQTRDWRIQTRRPDGVTVVGSVADLKVDDTSISNRDAALMSWTLGAADPFTVDGIQVGLSNTSTQTITITSVSVRVQRIINPEP